MGDDKHNGDRSLIDKPIGVPLRQSWLEVLGNVGQVVRNIVQARSCRGMEEVLECDATLELKDQGGKRASFKKREEVRYLRNNIVAYQDQTWGDEEIFVDYRCSPGTPVDRYRSGYKTYVLISRRDIKNEGDVAEFNVEWGIRQGFLWCTEQWKTHTAHGQDTSRSP